MIVDLHTHTRDSFDGFTSPMQLLDACVRRGIGAIAVTEHDRRCAIDPEQFVSRGVEIVPGCEFTTDAGAHILGLFVADGLEAGRHRRDILEHIRSQDGIAVMPHPWKPGSGYMAIHGEDEFVGRFQFIELLNGGWKARDSAPWIRALAERYGMRMIASSDSHRACQVGLCATRLLGSVAEAGGLRKYLDGVQQDHLELLVDARALSSRGRRTRPFQRLGAYQLALTLVPTGLRSMAKRMHYLLGSDGVSSDPDYQVVLSEATSW